MSRNIFTTCMQMQDIKFAVDDCIMTAVNNMPEIPAEFEKFAEEFGKAKIGSEAAQNLIKCLSDFGLSFDGIPNIDECIIDDIDGALEFAGLYNVLQTIFHHPRVVKEHVKWTITDIFST